jgi:hypothetical protein
MVDKELRFVLRDGHRILQQYLETPRADDYDGPTTMGWYDVPLVTESAVDGEANDTGN